MSDTWELISGYETTDYTDTMVFEVDPDTKKLEKISGQTLVEGEKNSQFIRFLMPRYWDGIDISEKTIRIIFDLNNSTYFGRSEAVGAERTDDKIRFGWVVPAEACAVKGTLLFVIIVQDSGYVLKTQITDTPVLKSLSESGDIPEPTKEIWYENFKVRIETAVSDAENALSEAKLTLEKALSMFGAPLIARTAEGMTDPERVYVYVGSETGDTFGNWYVYDGTAWVSGGVYNAVALNIDSALSATSDNPVKNKAIYEAINEVKESVPALTRVKDDETASGGVIEGNIELNRARGQFSHAEGVSTSASASSSHAEGGGTEASGEASHAEGANTKATGADSHAEGGGTTASGDYSHSEGNGTTANKPSSHAEGGNTTASGNASHAEGGGTIASGSASHAEGAMTSATGANSHAEGGGTKAIGSESHAEGGGTEASGQGSHAEGGGTIASGTYSHAEGSGTIARGYAQSVIGKFNVENGTNASSDYVFIVGNGTANDHRSNAFAIKWDGTIVFANGTEITPVQFASLLALLT